MPYRITHCYLPPGRGDIPALTPAETGTRFSDPGGMQGRVDLDKASPQEHQDDMPRQRQFNGGKNSSRSMSIRGWVRSPRISDGQR